jgi:hypothetical protein
VSGITARVYGRLAPVTLMIVLAIAASRPAAAAAAPPGTWSASKVGTVKGAATVPACVSSARRAACGPFAVTSAGGDVGRTADAFTSATRKLEGDGVIVARVSMSARSRGKAGLMLRESMTAGAKHVFLYMSPGAPVGLDRRHVTNGATIHNQTVPTGAVAWLKLERRAGVFVMAYVSEDGQKWRSAGAGAIQMADALSIGLVATGADVAATFSSVTVSPLLPDQWQTTDIGSPRPGTVASIGTRLHVETVSTDIGDRSDRFQFVYKKVSGDFAVVARVGSLSSSDPLARAGLMLRHSLAVDSAHASLFLTAGKGVAFQRRTSTGAVQAATAGPTATTPGWLKLERRGSVVTALWSKDAKLWAVVGTEALTLPSTIYAGIAVTAHGDTTAVAQIDSVGVSVLAERVNEKPTVFLTAPVPDAIVSAKSSLTLAADATDPDGTVTRVDFFVAGKLVATDTAAPYSVAWNASSPGRYAVYAVAYDNENASAASAAFSFTVRASTTTTPKPGSGSDAVGPGTLKPVLLGFEPSADDAVVSFYRLEIYVAGRVPGKAVAAVTQDLGKPRPIKGESRVDIASALSVLPSGRYIAVVTAVGPGGQTRSAPSAAFNK